MSGRFPAFKPHTERIVSNRMIITGVLSPDVNQKIFFKNDSGNKYQGLLEKLILHYFFDKDEFASGKYSSQEEYFMKTLGVPNIPFDLIYQERQDAFVVFFKTQHGPPYKMFQRMSSENPQLCLYCHTSGFLDSTYFGGIQSVNVDTSHVQRGLETTFLIRPVGECPIMEVGFNKY